MKRFSIETETGYITLDAANRNEAVKLARANGYKVLSVTQLQDEE